MQTKTCNITEASFKAGLWSVRVDVKVGPNCYGSTHQIEGDENWTPEQLKEAVLALY